MKEDNIIIKDKLEFAEFIALLTQDKNFLESVLDHPLTCPDCKSNLYLNSKNSLQGHNFDVVFFHGLNQAGHVPGRGWNSRACLQESAGCRMGKGKSSDWPCTTWWPVARSVLLS